MEDLKTVNVDRICSEVAFETKHSVEQVKRVHDFQFKFLSKAMDDGSGKIIKIDYLGKFKVNVKFVDKLKKSKNGLNNYR